MANSVDPDQTATPIWVCTVCPDLSVRKLRNITVLFIFVSLWTHLKLTLDSFNRPIVFGLCKSPQVHVCIQSTELYNTDTCTNVAIFYTAF